MVAKFSTLSAFLFASVLTKDLVIFAIRIKSINAFFDVTLMLRLYFDIIVNVYLAMTRV